MDRLWSREAFEGSTLTTPVHFCLCTSIFRDVHGVQMQLEVRSRTFLGGAVTATRNLPSLTATRQALYSKSHSNCYSIHHLTFVIVFAWKPLWIQGVEERFSFRTTLSPVCARLHVRGPYLSHISIHSVAFYLWRASTYP